MKKPKGDLTPGAELKKALTSDGKKGLGTFTPKSTSSARGLARSIWRLWDLGSFGVLFVW